MGDDGAKGSGVGINKRLNELDEMKNVGTCIEAHRVWVDFIMPRRSLIPL